MYPTVISQGVNSFSITSSYIKLTDLSPYSELSVLWYYNKNSRKYKNLRKSPNKSQLKDDVVEKKAKNFLPPPPQKRVKLNLWNQKLHQNK